MIDLVRGEALDKAIERVRLMYHLGGVDDDASLAAALVMICHAAARYQWVRERWDANTDEDLEQFNDAMNASDPDAAIDAARALIAESGSKT